MTHPTGFAGKRAFSRRSPYVLNEEAYETAIALLVSSLAEAGPVTTVIGIAGGGTAPAERIAARLDVPACRIGARHNSSDALYVQATGAVTVTLPGDFPAALGGRVVLVDDICGSGATFTAVTGALATRTAADTQVETVALCRNVGSRVAPGRWVWDVDDWVVFPWETCPDIPVRPLPLPGKVLTP